MSSTNVSDSDIVAYFPIFLRYKLYATYYKLNGIIGSWELIGHGEGWFPGLSQPCSQLDFTEGEIVFNFSNSFLDTTTFHTWVISEDSIRPRLVITPRLSAGVIINTICDDYMYGNFTFVDGQMHLYEKVD